MAKVITEYLVRSPQALPHSLMVKNMKWHITLGFKFRLWDLNRHFSTGDMQMDKHMKRYSISIVLREMPHKTMMKYH